MRSSHLLCDPGLAGALASAAPSPAQLEDPAIEPMCSVHCGLSRKCNGSRGELMRWTAPLK